MQTIVVEITPNFRPGTKLRFIRLRIVLTTFLFYFIIVRLKVLTNGPTHSIVIKARTPGNAQYQRAYPSKRINEGLE